MILGIHCAVWRGFDAALKEATDLNCGAMQMLPYRRHHDPSASEIARFNAQRAQSPVKRLAVHSRFVPSLGSSDQARRRRSIELLAYELGLAGRLGAEMFVCHAGAYSEGSSAEEGIHLIAESLTAGRNAAGSSIRLVLENVTGGGRRLGGTLEELASLLELAASEGGWGICLDTAHAWAAGYDVATRDGMEKFLSRANELFGSRTICAFHLNDTQAAFGSRRENHCHWGEGFLGDDGLRLLLSKPEYASAIGIIESPKTGDWDRKNLEYVRRLSA